MSSRPKEFVAYAKANKEEMQFRFRRHDDRTTPEYLAKICRADGLPRVRYAPIATKFCSAAR
jgi:hypothetical protein